jgi:hypothetical protein
MSRSIENRAQLEAARPTGSLAPESTGSENARWPALSPVFRVVDRLVYLSDSALTIPGTRFRFGLDPIIGLIPGGDAVGGAVSLSVLLLGLQHRLPVWVLWRMVLNISLDTAFGSVPFVGDLFDFGFRANQRNMQLLRAHKERPLPATMPKSYWAWGVVLVSLALVLAALPIVLSVWLVGWLLSGGA